MDLFKFNDKYVKEELYSNIKGIYNIPCSNAVNHDIS